jgi:hypothetical protein
VPKEPAVSWASTVTPPRGATCSRRISTDNPISIVPSSAPSISSVRWARLARGWRKTGTPLAIASIPVSAEQAGQAHREQVMLQRGKRRRQACRPGR